MAAWVGPGGGGTGKPFNGEPVPDWMNQLPEPPTWSSTVQPAKLPPPSSKPPLVMSSEAEADEASAPRRRAMKVMKQFRIDVFIFSGPCVLPQYGGQFSE